MSILAFDIGGTSVKYGVWNDSLSHQSSFKLPSSWDEMKTEMKKVFDSFTQETFEGVALSAPGSVDQEAGIIGGISAVDYIHDFLILDDLEALFGVSVSMENDANCAALAEVWQGKAKDVETALFVVIGTGIGGAIIQEGKLLKGANLFAGEFGIMMLNETMSFSEGGTAVKMANRYCDRLGVTRGTFSGEEVFEKALQGDRDAQIEENAFYDNLSLGIYNLMFTTDPHRIILGGGVTQHKPLVPTLKKRIDQRLKDKGLTIKYDLTECLFMNDANLVGAVYNFTQKVKA